MILILFVLDPQESSDCYRRLLCFVYRRLHHDDHCLPFNPISCPSLGSRGSWSDICWEVVWKLGLDCSCLRSPVYFWWSQWNSLHVLQVIILSLLHLTFFSCSLSFLVVIFLSLSLWLINYFLLSFLSISLFHTKHTDCFTREPNTTKCQGFFPWFKLIIWLQCLLYLPCVSCQSSISSPTTSMLWSIMLDSPLGWQLDWLSCVSHTWDIRSLIFPDQSKYTSSGPIFTFWAPSSLLLFQWLLILWEPDGDVSWSWQESLFTSCSLDGRTNLSSFKRFWEIRLNSYRRWW